MANPEHVSILREGVRVWNEWRMFHIDSEQQRGLADFLDYLWSFDRSIENAELKILDMVRGNLSGADFIKANLSKVNLEGANLKGTDFTEANMNSATFCLAELDGASLVNTHLVSADFSGAKLQGANLRGANLCRANLCGAQLVEANLAGAYLIGANLSQANFNRADLKEANLIEAKIRNASFQGARLMKAKLDSSELTGACLWETQRAGWSIKGIVCESIYWDEKAEKPETFGPSEFERLHSEKTRVQVKYPGGITPVEIATLPALIQRLESAHPGSKLRLESIQNASGGAILSLVIDDPADEPSKKIEDLRTAFQLEAENITRQFRLAVEEKERIISRICGQVDALKWTFNELLFSHKPNIYLDKGDLNMSSDTYNISGQAGAIGPNAHAHDMTFQQIGSRIESSMDLATLANELEALRQALKEEATTEEHDLIVADISKAKKAAEAKDSSKLAEHLKSAGKWALDAATKMGTSLVTEAIKEAMGMK